MVLSKGNAVPLPALAALVVEPVPHKRPQATNAAIEDAQHPAAILTLLSVRNTAWPQLKKLQMLLLLQLLLLLLLLLLLPRATR